MRHRIALALAALSVLLAAPHAASEDDAFERDLARCTSFSDRGKWEAAAKAYADLFEAYPGDSRIVARIRDIEDDLRRCHFRMHYEPPSGVELFGAGTKSFSRSSRMLTLEYRRLSGKPWTAIGDVAFLDIRFESSLTVELRAPTLLDGKVLAVFVFYDAEKEGGYMVVPGHQVPWGKAGWKAPQTILRLDQDGRKTLHSGYGPYECMIEVKVERKSSNLKLSIDGKKAASVRDRTYRRGAVALSGPRPEWVKIRGRVEENHLKQLLGAHEGAAFRKWSEESWHRDRVIPPWARREPAATGVTPARLPSDAPEALRAKLGPVLGAALSGDPEAWEELPKLAEALPERTGLLVRAVLEMGEGGAKKAEEMLTELVRKEPGFATALALRGIARLHLRKVEAAGADFDAAAKKDPKGYLAYLGRSNLAILAGDLAAAAAALDAAVPAGADCPELESARREVHRAKRGPLWRKVHEVTTSHFEIRSDHSEKLCHEVANLLEGALDAYALHFPDAEVGRRKARVYVFAHEAGYLAYAEGTGRTLTGSAGAYNPRLRELVLFMPEHRMGFVHTVRHEGFHRFLHEFVDEVPIWFDEGCAEYFSCAREKFGGGIEPGEVDDDALALLRAGRKHLSSLADLFTMDQRTFMKKGALHYAQSWSVVHFLQTTSKRDLKGLFREYFRALRDGQSRAEAYASVLEPHLREIEYGWRRHVGFSLFD